VNKLIQSTAKGKKSGALLMSVADTDTDTEYYVIFSTCHRRDRDAKQTLNNKSRISHLTLPTLCDIKVVGIPARRAQLKFEIT
jgi:hypothetical protein